jgi:hypothetical protein
MVVVEAMASNPMRGLLNFAWLGIARGPTRQRAREVLETRLESRAQPVADPDERFGLE